MSSLYIFEQLVNWIPEIPVDLNNNTDAKKQMICASFQTNNMIIATNRSAYINHIRNLCNRYTLQIIAQGYDSYIYYLAV